MKTEGSMVMDVVDSLNRSEDTLRGLVEACWGMECSGAVPEYIFGLFSSVLDHEADNLLHAADALSDRYCQENNITPVSVRASPASPGVSEDS